MSPSQPNQFELQDNTFGLAKQFVCDAEMYCFPALTDFYIPAASKFGFARKMLYLCNVNHERQKGGRRPPDVVGRTGI